MKTETSITPLSDWNGYHVFYKKVAEKRKDNSKTIYRFETELWSQYNHNRIYGNGQYPFKGSPIYMESDKLKSLYALDVSGSTVSSSINDNKLSQIGTIANDLKAYRIENYYTYSAGGPQTSSYLVHFAQFIELPRAFDYGRLKSKTEITNGIEIKTDYKYSELNKHNNPVEISVTNSTGKVHKTKLFYPIDYVDDPTFASNSQTFVNKFIIDIPIKTLSYVDNTLVGGQKVEFEAFSYGLLPKRYYKINQYATQYLVNEIDSYNSYGLPERVVGKDQVVKHYYWDNKKRLTDMVIGSFSNSLNKSIKYYDNTELVQKLVSNSRY